MLLLLLLLQLLLLLLLLLLLPLLPLSCFSRVRLCATPENAAHQAPPSLGFSRQEHWSGLPFPSPMHESESEVAQSCRLLATPWTAAYQALLSMGFSRQEQKVKRAYHALPSMGFSAKSRRQKKPHKKQATLSYPQVSNPPTFLSPTASGVK